MHIPDGFLSPQTCVACYAAAAPFWYVAWQKLKQQFARTTAAHVGLAAAFVFLLQMMNVPIPGGTTGHAVGTVVVGIAIGPAAAIVAVTLALALQALVFGDGGLGTFGANVVTMAIVPALVGWAIWNLFGQARSSRARSAAAFFAGYASALAGGVVTGILLGVQPMLFRSETGLPNYFPLGLEVSVPAMFVSHLFIGVIEGAVTLGALAVLKTLPDFSLPAAPSVTLWRRGLGVLACMVALVPIGVILPTLTGAGEPWGEWAPHEAAEIANLPHVPAGMEAQAESYAAPVADYQFAPASSLTGESTQYVGAALLGILLVGVLCLPLHRLQQARLKKLRSH